MKNKTVLYITKTAMMLALLIGIQFATRSLTQFVTGSLVNLVLLTSVFMVGLGGGLTVAIASPFLAFLAGIGPAFIQIVPFVAVGNAILALVAYAVSRKRIGGKGLKETALAAAGLVAAAAAKTLFLWVGLVIIALPLIHGLNEKQVTMIGTMFTWPQLVTALIGGALAMALVPLLKRATKREG